MFRSWLETAVFMNINFINPLEVAPTKVEPRNDFVVLINPSKHYSLAGGVWKKKEESWVHHHHSIMSRLVCSHLIISTVLYSDYCYFQFIGNVNNVSNLPKLWFLWVGKLYLNMCFMVPIPTFYHTPADLPIYWHPYMQRKRHSLLIAFCICS